jgi:23S rRNA (guanosine2251-2'-O)-methyltransferase
MAGNSQRRGARRNPGSKKGSNAGSGGRRRQALEGKGPTPKAEQRTGHPAARRAGAAARRTASQQGRSGSKRPAAAGSGRRGRSDRDTAEVVAGRNPVLEAIRAGVPAVALYVAERIDSDDRVRDVVKLAAERRVPLLEAPRTELDRIAGGSVHQGLVLQVPPYEYAHPDELLQRARQAGRAPLIVALDGVTDPRNLGAVVRSVAAFGGDGVLVPERRAAGMTVGAWKTSAGAAARLPVARATNLTRALESYRKAGLTVVGLAAGAESSLPDIEVATEPLVVVVGSEGKGLSRLVRETCDLTVSIPISAETESLNAGVAAGIALYELAGRRR